MKEIELAKFTVRWARGLAREARIKHVRCEAELAGARAAKETYDRSAKEDYGGGWDQHSQGYVAAIERAEISLERALAECAKYDKLEEYIVDTFLEGVTGPSEIARLKGLLKNCRTTIAGVFGEDHCLVVEADAFLAHFGASLE